MSFVPVTSKPCPEPPKQENLTFSFIIWGSSCYGGYSQGVRVNYSCTEKPGLEPPKTMECGSEGVWREIDSTPWPKCETSAEVTDDGNNGNSGKVSFKILYLIRDYNGQVF
jgi:hypothetical protein